MVKDRYLAAVRAQYEQFPFPVRRPGDEERRLVVSEVDRLAKIDHFCFGGRRDFREPMRILVAGGGTGDALVFLAEQLRGSPCEFVYLDISEASLETAQARIEARNLGGVRWVQASITEIPELDLGRFDYINCIGVLHHLPDPDVGLRCLRSVLADDGSMGLMLYGRHGRRHVYVVQQMMQLLCGEDPDLASQLQVTRSALDDLGKTGIISVGKDMRKRLGRPEFDTYLVDTYLHQQDRPYSVTEIYEFLSAADLALASFTNFFSTGGLATPLDYDPSLYFNDPAVIERALGLSRCDREQLAEILCSSLSMHAFYASAGSGNVASLADLSLAPYFATRLARELGEAAAAGDLENLDVTFQGGVRRIFRLAPIAQAVVALIDGKRTSRDLATLAVQASPGAKAEEVVRAALEALDLLLGLGLISLRDPELPQLQCATDGPGWSGSLNWLR